MKWVKLPHYCKQTGDTSHAVHHRRRTGVWQDGVHGKMVDGRLWVNMEAVQAWIEGNPKEGEKTETHHD